MVRPLVGAGSGLTARWTSALLVWGLVLVSACGQPITVRHDAAGAQRLVASNVFTTGEISRRTRNLLFDRDLIERYDKDPAGTLATLHEDFVAGRLKPGDAAYLTELSFYHAEHGGGSPHYPASR